MTPEDAIREHLREVRLHIQVTARSMRNARVPSGVADAHQAQCRDELSLYRARARAVIAALRMMRPCAACAAEKARMDELRASPGCWSCGFDPCMCDQQ